MIYTKEQLNKAYMKAIEITGCRVDGSEREYIGTIFEPYHDVSIYKNIKTGKFEYRKFYIGD